MKKSLIVAVATLGVVSMFTLGGCAAGGVASIDGDTGYVAVTRSIFGFPLAPKILRCDAGTCITVK